MFGIVVAVRREVEGRDFAIGQARLTKGPTLLARQMTLSSRAE